jgi:hypothetical protein
MSVMILRAGHRRRAGRRPGPGTRPAACGTPRWTAGRAGRRDGGPGVRRVRRYRGPVRSRGQMELALAVDDPRLGAEDGLVDLVEVGSPGPRRAAPAACDRRTTRSAGAYRPGGAALAPGDDATAGVDPDSRAVGSRANWGTPGASGSQNDARHAALLPGQAAGRAARKPAPLAPAHCLAAVRPRNQAPPGRNGHRAGAGAVATAQSEAVAMVVIVPSGAIRRTSRFPESTT